MDLDQKFKHIYNQVLQQKENATKTNIDQLLVQHYILLSSINELYKITEEYGLDTTYILQAQNVLKSIDKIIRLEKGSNRALEFLYIPEEIEELIEDDTDTDRAKTWGMLSVLSVEVVIRYLGEEQS
nr:hypothetical protein 27 [bacterium]